MLVSSSTVDTLILLGPIDEVLTVKMNRRDDVAMKARCGAQKRHIQYAGSRRLAGADLAATLLQGISN